MSRKLRLAAGGVALGLVASSLPAETDHAKERADTAYFNYSHDDQAIGGRMASLYVNVSPTWPPSDRVQVYYSVDQCTLDYCYDYGWGTYCYCDFMSMQHASGNGQIPASAFQISSQGLSRLDFSPEDIVGGYTDGDCGGLHLGAEPNGEWHWSENGQISVDTPTDATRAVSRDDEWQVNVTGPACFLGLEAGDPGTGNVHRAEWNRVSRTKKQ